MSELAVHVKHRPVLDRDFVPAVLWNAAYRARVEQTPDSAPLVIAVTRADGTVFRHETAVLPHVGDAIPLNVRFLERIVKLLLWMKGGSEIIIAGQEGLAAAIAELYAPRGRRAFDFDVVGRRIFLRRMSVASCALADVPANRVVTVALGRNRDGCRIGFDLGGSDRKCAAVVEGEAVFSDEVGWNPYFQTDPRYHYEGIMDSLRRAAAHLPRVDAIGGSAAGVYVDNEPRVASLFRGISEVDFDKHIRPIFKRIRSAWNEVPFEVANDGEVTALAASMSLHDRCVLGISMGTSQAAGYCDSDGRITPCLNELAFVPVDYRSEAPVDEWSGDFGCGVQYFSQQAVARLAPRAGIEFPDELPLADRLQQVQALLDAGDRRARKIYETIGTYLGYSIAWYAEWYDIRHLLILGRVTSGPGGELLIGQAGQVLRDDFPELASRIHVTMPDERLKRHGQAIAAASLPILGGTGGVDKP